MDLDNIQRKYGLPAPLPVVQNGKFATRYPVNLEHRGDDVFQFGGKYIGEIENIYDLLYKILTNQEIDASLSLPYAIKITEDKLYVRDKTNSEWIVIFDITKPNFPKEIELYELIYKAITHQVISEDTSYPGQFKIEENILYVRDKDNLTWTQIGDVTKEFLGATEATQAILDQVNEILTEVQELKTELNRQIATTNETLTTALKAANEAMTSAQSINIRTFNSVEEMKASNTLKAGALAKTQGFYAAGDGGGADYLVTDDIGEDEIDEASVIALQNNLYAKLIIKDFINVKQWGAYGDGVHDDTKALQKAIDYREVKLKYFPNGVYCVSDTLYTDAEHKCQIQLNSSEIKAIGSNLSNKYVIELGGKGNGLTYGQSSERCEIFGGVANANYLAYGGIRISNMHFGSVHHMSIIKCNMNPLCIDVPVDSTSADAYVREVYLSGTLQVGSIALDVQANDNNIAYVRTAGCYTGIKLSKGGNILTECHPLAWLNNDPDVNQDIAFHLESGDDNYLENCYSDGFNTCIKVENNIAFVVRDFIAAFGTYNEKCVVFDITGDYFNGDVDGVVSFKTGGDLISCIGYKGTLKAGVYNIGRLKNIKINNLTNAANDPVRTSPLAVLSRTPYIVTTNTNLNSLNSTAKWIINNASTSSSNNFPTGLTGAYGVLVVQSIPRTELAYACVLQDMYLTFGTNTHYRRMYFGDNANPELASSGWSAWEAVQ